MCVLGAIFVDEAVIEPLTDYILLGPDKLGEQKMLFVARLFRALAAGLRESG
jgi:hypothetical protein